MLCVGSGIIVFFFFLSVDLSGQIFCRPFLQLISSPLQRTLECVWWCMEGPNTLVC